MDVRKHITDAINKTGAKSPMIVGLRDGSSFPAIFTGINVINNIEIVTLINTNTRVEKTIPIGDISELAKT